MVFLCFFVMNNFGMDVSQCWKEIKINVYFRAWTQPHLTHFLHHTVWGKKVWKQYMWMRGNPVSQWDRKLGGWAFHTSDQLNNFPTFMNAALSVCAADRLILSSWWNKDRKHKQKKNIRLVVTRSHCCWIILTPICGAKLSSPSVLLS